MPGMDGFREYSEPGIWSQTIKRPAHEWFSGAFGVNIVVANVGGCVFRKGLACGEPDLAGAAPNVRVLWR